MIGNCMGGAIKKRPVKMWAKLNEEYWVSLCIILAQSLHDKNELLIYRLLKRSLYK